MSDSGLLEIRRGKEVRTCSISRPVTNIGREADNQVVLQDEQVSRHHARLQWEGGFLCVADLGSTNGTRLNGVEVKEARRPYALKLGDSIGIGPFTLVLRQ
jgi:pSer/pThr/pTyr-binding forkhead associated (FHA) protein